MALPRWLRRFFDLETPEPETRLSEEEVLAAARDLVAEEGWPWEEPIQVQLLPGRRGKPRTWEVLSNANMRGSNVKIWIDDRTGAIVKKWLLPR